MLMDRVVGVFKLSAATFEEIEHDQNATGQAALIVVIVTVLSALGGGIGARMTGGSFLLGLISALIWTFIGWFIWSLISYFVGTTLFNGKATVDEMLRVIGFALAPLSLSIIPCIGGFIGAIWALVAGFVAVRQGLDLDDLRAFLTILIGFGVYFVGYIAINAVLIGFNAFLR